MRDPHHVVARIHVKVPIPSGPGARMRVTGTFGDDVVPGARVLITGPGHTDENPIRFIVMEMLPGWRRLPNGLREGRIVLEVERTH